MFFFWKEIFIFANQLFETSILNVISHHLSSCIICFWKIAFIKLP